MCSSDLIVSLLEGYLYTSRFSGDLFTSEDFLHFQSYALANAVVYCWVRGAVVLGLMLAWCDNDGSELRENFIGSESVPVGPKDRGWIDAGLFGTLQLVDTEQK